MALVWLKVYPTYEVLGFLFDLHKRNTQLNVRAVLEVLELLDDFPFERNRVRLAYGTWLRRRRHTAQAREALALAAEGFDALGAPPWSERARTELRAAGAVVKRSDREISALTAQERKIAELASVGHSNKQIAAQLYLSPRTVGAHLYRVFPKLGVTSRAGLAAAMRELPSSPIEQSNC